MGSEPYTLHVGGIDFKNAYSSSNKTGHVTAITSSSGGYSTKPRPPESEGPFSPFSFPGPEDPDGEAATADATNKKHRAMKRSKSTAADFALDMTVPSENAAGEARLKKRAERRKSARAASTRSLNIGESGDFASPVVTEGEEAADAGILNLYIRMYTNVHVE